MRVLKSSHLSCGPEVLKFELAFAKYVGVKHAVAVSSGTSGLHLGLRALGIGEGDLVITTPFSFVASANCLLFERAQPVFADIDRTTYNIDPAKIEAAIFGLPAGKRKKLKAILAVDVFGRSADWYALGAIAKKHGLKLIEDSCEALGTTYRGKKCGCLGDFGVFGFYPNKQITTGEGGMITTNSRALSDACRSMRNQGRVPGGGLEVSRLGYNYRMDEMSAALGFVQLKRLPELLEKRARVAKWYSIALRQAQCDKIRPHSDDSWFVYTIEVAHRDRVVAYLRKNGIECNNYFPAIHLQPMYMKMGYRKGDFPVCELVSSRTLALPFHPNLTYREVRHVVTILQKALS